ncbi:hypothetical protein BDR26DRAFT_892162 [Obelidium mucronatum]|nr:hypothetical protein BDR26DRAFT_892162 [Obelidium mucronatum]
MVFEYSTVGSVYALDTVEMKVILHVGKHFWNGKPVFVTDTVTYICGNEPPKTFNPHDGIGVTSLRCTAGSCGASGVVCDLVVQPAFDPVKNIDVTSIRYFGNQGRGGLCYKNDPSCPGPQEITPSPSPVPTTVPPPPPQPKPEPTTTTKSELPAVITPITTIPKTETTAKPSTNVQNTSTTRSTTRDSTTSTLVVKVSPTTTSQAQQVTEQSSSFTVVAPQTTAAVLTTSAVAAQTTGTNPLPKATPSAAKTPYIPAPAAGTPGKILHSSSGDARFQISRLSVIAFFGLMMPI